MLYFDPFSVFQAVLSPFLPAPALVGPPGDPFRPIPRIHFLLPGWTLSFVTLWTYSGGNRRMWWLDWCHCAVYFWNSYRSSREAVGMAIERAQLVGVWPVLRVGLWSFAKDFVLKAAVYLGLVHFCVCLAALWVETYKTVWRGWKRRCSWPLRSKPSSFRLTQLRRAHNQALATFLERRAAPPSAETGTTDWDDFHHASSAARQLCQELMRLEEDGLGLAVYELRMVDSEPLYSHPLSLACAATVDTLLRELRVPHSLLTTSSSAPSYTSPLSCLSVRLRRLLSRLLFQTSSPFLPFSLPLSLLIHLQRSEGRWVGDLPLLYRPFLLSSHQQQHDQVLLFLDALRELLRRAGIVRPEEASYAAETVRAWWVEEDWAEVVRTERRLHREVLDWVLRWKEENERGGQ
ncbi:hypothetical protein JCM8547_008447 [Rhodosporidiobolus lusitaniae]